MLYLDVGNHALKLARFDGSAWSPAGRFAHEDLSGLAAAIGGESVVGCSVVESVRERLPQVAWVTRDRLPAWRLDYDTPDTLGIDRFVACEGARSQSAGDVVVVDAGTACTIDWMSADGVFHGGVIMPGLGLMEDSLRRHAPALPPVEREHPATFPPKSTRDALKAGLFMSWSGIVRAHVNALKVLAPSATVWLTGQDSVLLDLAAERDEWLIPKGLRSLTGPPSS